MPRLDYSKTVIYHLTCPTFNDVYVNHTTSLRNKKYLYSHPQMATKHIDFYDTIKLHGGFNNWKMIVLEKYSDCKTAVGAKKKVEEWVKRLQAPPTPSNLPPETSEFPPETSEFPPATSDPPPATVCNTCKKCGKKFTRHDNLQRHIKSRCIIKPDVRETEPDVKEEIETLREQLAKKDEEHHKMIESVREEMKKEIKKQNKQKKQQTLCNSNSNNRIINQQNNSNNNTTINNHNITIELGKEKLSEVFTHKQQKNILEKGYNSLRELIHQVHFNPKYTQFQNLCITNMLGPFGHKYIEDVKDFVIVNKNDLSKELVETRMYDIEEFLENCKGTMLTERKVKTLNDFIEKMEDKKYAEEKIRNLSIDLYNFSTDIDMKDVMKKVRNAKHVEDAPHVVSDVSSQSEITPLTV